MCSSQEPDPQQPKGGVTDAATAAPFPNDDSLLLYDAHCHPTDTMASTASIPSMRARTLTIMATRSQDQELVASIADTHSSHVVPAFGWHPWFSYQLYDDHSAAESGAGIDKAVHYAKVLSPAPDNAFVASLPDPIPLSKFISDTSARLQKYPSALVGEIGLDRAFRLPEAEGAASQHVLEGNKASRATTPGGREGRRLSPYRVNLDHQTAILTAQLRLAGSLGRAVSVHGVQAHGALFNAISACWKGHEKEVVGRRKRRLAAPGAEDFSSDSSSDDDDDDYNASRTTKSLNEKVKASKQSPQGLPFPPRICLHSFSGGPEIVKQYLTRSNPATIFFSFSAAVNRVTESAGHRTAEALVAIPDNRILVESDLHTAGAEMDAALQEMYQWVCKCKGWDLEAGCRQIAANYQEYVYG